MGLAQLGKAARLGSKAGHGCGHPNPSLISYGVPPFTALVPRDSYDRIKGKLRIFGTHQTAT